MSKDGKKFYVYEDWTHEEIPRCFYVGKGKHGRISTKKRNKYHQRVMEKHGLNRVIVFETLNEEEAFQEEIRLIRERRTFYHDPEQNGVGCNFTLGGDGQSGRVMSEQGRRNIAQAQLGRKKSPEMLAHLSAVKMGNDSAACTYEMIDPGGSRVTIHNMSKFCEENGLQRHKMYDVVSGKRYEYEGWMLADEAKRFKPKKSFTVIDPDGNQHQIYHLTDFCRKNGLDSMAMFRVKQKGAKHHRGWRVL